MPLRCQLPCAAEADGGICNENLKAEVVESSGATPEGAGKAARKGKGSLMRFPKKNICNPRVPLPFHLDITAAKQNYL